MPPLNLINLIQTYVRPTPPHLLHIDIPGKVVEILKNDKKVLTLFLIFGIMIM